jgi:hypothetical protein
MKPMAAAVAGALISGMAMYAVGARAAQDDPRLVQNPALVQSVDGQYAYASSPAAQPRAMFVSNPAPAARVQRAAPRRTVYRSVEPAPVYSRDDAYQHEEDVRPDKRSWSKSALIIGGSAASGAGVGGIMGGKKGAMIGAAIGGGAASIYEATRRR